jgi:DNA-binding NtrC family response regulator
MSRLAPPDGPAVLVSWVSVGARAAPLLAALDEDSPLYRKVQKLYLLWRDAPEADERAVVAETTSTLRTQLEPHCPEIVRVPWKTQAAPTDHGAIRKVAEAALRRVRDENPGAHVFVHVSPGTPAMHAVWLVLCATGFVAPPVTMIQGTPKEKRAEGAPPIAAVSVEFDTWLRRVRASRPASQHDDAANWDPTELAPNGAMRRVLRRLEELADLPAPVLLLGERGTGKTTLANYLRAMGRFQAHDGRGRPKPEWQSVVCGQFRGEVNLARSELFGHAKDAFTGATRERVGRLELAHGDCLFLDEIADIDKDTQRLLIRAVEKGKFHRMGENIERSSTFRLICATNRTLDQLAGGVLDADFFDRIAVFTIEVPPLRACREDLPVFWRDILRRIAGKADVDAPGWEQFLSHEEVLTCLRAHPLPGNVRDLQRVAWHIVAALHAGRTSESARDAGLATLARGADDSLALPSLELVRAALPLATPLPNRLDAIRDRYVEAAMAAAGGNQSEAARLLGVKRETFKSWLRPTGGVNAPVAGEKQPLPVLESDS